MENLSLNDLIIWKYVALVITVGHFLSQDKLVKSFPSWLKLTMLKVSKFYRVAILSAILGFVYWKIDKEVDILNLIISYAFANIIYSAGAKYLFKSNRN